MKWVFRLERKLGSRFGIPNLMIYITAPMFAAYALWFIGFYTLPYYMVIFREQVMAGEVWRLATFLVMPQFTTNVFFALLGILVSYFLGSALEREWGKTLFTMYFIFGALGAIIAAMIAGAGTNNFLLSSILLAYAYVYPDATFLLFMILPVKAKYLAYVMWGFYIYFFITGNMASRLAIVFSLLNFFLFFGPNVLRTTKQSYRRFKRRKQFRQNWGDNWR